MPERSDDHPRTEPPPGQGLWPTTMHGTREPVLIRDPWPGSDVGVESPGRSPMHRWGLKVFDRLRRLAE